MKTTKIITFALFAAFLISVLSVSAFAAIEESDLEDNLKFYHRLSKEFTEDFIECVYGEEKTFSSDLIILEDCEKFLTQAALFLKDNSPKDPKEYYELNFALNDIKLDMGGGNMHVTATVKFLESGEIIENSLEFFLRIGSPQKVITVTDALVFGDAKLEKILYHSETMTLDKFMTEDKKDYAALAKELEPYNKYSADMFIPDESLPTPSDDSDYFISNPETSDISMIFYILAAISSVFACSTFRRKG